MGQQGEERVIQQQDAGAPEVTAIPSSRREGARKFFLPRIIKEPVGRYSPEGAVFDT